MLLIRSKIMRKDPKFKYTNGQLQNILDTSITNEGPQLREKKISVQYCYQVTLLCVDAFWSRSNVVPQFHLNLELSRSAVHQMRFFHIVFAFYSVIYFTRAITLHFRLLFGSNKIICFYKPSGIHSSIILFA